MVLKALASICAKNDADMPLCVLVSRINATRSENSTNALISFLSNDSIYSIHEILYNVPQSNFTPEYADVKAMVAHFESKSTEWKKVILNACTDIEKAFSIRLARMQADGVDVSKVASLPPIDLAHIAAKINTNSHALTSLIYHKTFALGLYPTLSLTSHSCEPNLYFTPTCIDPKPADLVSTRAFTRLELRALRDIRAGEELTINYIDTNDTRENRQRALAADKHFKCQCKYVLFANLV